MRKAFDINYYIISDIHSYCSLFKSSLQKQGFNPNNPNHSLIILGDIFDRGDESQQTLDWILELHNTMGERLILIRGNHEDLLLECLERKIPLSHDFSNRTVKTIYELGLTEDEKEKLKKLCEEYDTEDEWVDCNTAIRADCNTAIRADCNTAIRAAGGIPKTQEIWERREFFDSELFWKACIVTKEKVKSLIQNEFINYYETDKYIFTHCWIPLKEVTIEKQREIDPEVLANASNWAKKWLQQPMYITDTVYDPDWRLAHQKDWAEARWGNPFKLLEAGYNQTGKCIVSGHWHTSWIYARELSRHELEKNRELKKKGLISYQEYQDRYFKLFDKHIGLSNPFGPYANFDIAYCYADRLDGEQHGAQDEIQEGGDGRTNLSSIRLLDRNGDSDCGNGCYNFKFVEDFTFVEDFVEDEDPQTSFQFTPQLNSHLLPDLIAIDGCVAWSGQANVLVLK